jgi:hypothetical protein
VARAWRVPHIGETDCMADDTVPIGPVSVVKFPLCGNLNGNFSAFGPILRIWAIFIEQTQQLAAKFPARRCGNFLDRLREFWKGLRELSRRNDCLPLVGAFWPKGPC